MKLSNNQMKVINYGPQIRNLTARTVMNVLSSHETKKEEENSLKIIDVISIAESTETHKKKLFKSFLREHKKMTKNIKWNVCLISVESKNGVRINFSSFQWIQQKKSTSKA